jgi:hypothetical protein
MIERETAIPLGVGLVLAVVVHGVLFAAGPRLAGNWLSMRTALSLQHDDAMDDSDRDAAKRDLELGRDESVVRSSVAWIPYDDVRELIAFESVTEQPAVQMQRDPLEDAPLRLDATPPLPDTAPQRDAALAASAPPLPVPPMPIASMPRLSPPPLSLPDPTDAGEVALDVPVFESQRIDWPAPMPTQIAPPDEVQPDVSPPPQVVPDDAAAQAPPAPPTPEPEQPASAESRPTGAPRSDREAPPAALVYDTRRTAPGRVEVMDGLEVLPSAPRIGTASSLLSARSEAIFAITFDTEGDVSHVRMIRSSSYADIDGAIETASYKWKAQGEKLQSAPHTIEVTFHM